MNDIEQHFGGFTTPEAQSQLLKHAYKCDTSLEAMLVGAHQLGVNYLDGFHSRLIAGSFWNDGYSIAYCVCVCVCVCVFRLTTII
jgi:hypothetical protein